MTTINWHKREYSVNNQGAVGIAVTAPRATATVSDGAAALRWLTSRSLRKGKARQILDKELSGARE